MREKKTTPCENIKYPLLFKNPSSFGSSVRRETVSSFVRFPHSSFWPVRCAALKHHSPELSCGKFSWGYETHHPGHCCSLEQDSLITAATSLGNWACLQVSKGWPYFQGQELGYEVQHSLYMWSFASFANHRGYCFDFMKGVTGLPNCMQLWNHKCHQLPC